MSAPAPAANAGPALRDIHLPPTPDWWPLAPGWWLLVLLLLILLALGIWATRRWRQRRCLWVPVGDELDALAARHAETGNQAELAAGLSQLLRRAVIYRGGEAYRQGDAWQAQLERLAPGLLTADLIGNLDRGIYRDDESLDAALTMQACRRWLRQALRVSCPVRFLPQSARAIDATGKAQGRAVAQATARFGNAARRVEGHADGKVTRRTGY